MSSGRDRQLDKQMVGGGEGCECVAGETASNLVERIAFGILPLDQVKNGNRTWSDRPTNKIRRGGGLRKKYRPAGGQGDTAGLAGYDE